MLARLCLRRLLPLHGCNRAAPAIRFSSSNANSEQVEPDPDPERAGRSLAKLSKISQTLRAAIEEQAQYSSQAPELLVSLEKEVDDAYDLLRRALDRAGRPCTIEELGDRINQNILPVPVEALGYRDLLKAHVLRDTIERTLVALEVMPPLDTMVDGSDKPFDRKEHKAKERAALAASAAESAHGLQGGQEEKKEIVLKELRPVSPEELQKRKLYMENSFKMENVLFGYETALLEVGRVHKVTKGGTTFSLRALVVMGNRQGVAGFGEGKSDTAQHAIERACRDAKRNMLCINLHQGRTIAHRVRGKFVRSQVTLWPAPEGTGISSNNNFAAIFQLFGLKDVGAKLHGPRCMANSVKSMFNALSLLQTAEKVAKTRGLAHLPVQRVFRKGIRRRKFLTL